MLEDFSVKNLFLFLGVFFNILWRKKSLFLLAVSSELGKDGVFFFLAPLLFKNDDDE